MNTIKILSKLKNEEYLNRDHKIVLLILWDQFLCPDEKNSMSPSEIEKLGLYKSTKLQTTLKELVKMEFVDNMKGKYQITPKFQFMLGKMSYTQYKQDEEVSDVTGYTLSKIDEFLDEQVFMTRTMKHELNKALKVTSNQNKTIFSYFTQWYGDVDGHKKFNELNEYLNNY